MDITYWLVRSSSRRGGDGKVGVDEGNLILASYKITLFEYIMMLNAIIFQQIACKCSSVHWHN